MTAVPPALVLPWATPPLTPAPASQLTKVPPLWSRPVAPCVNGIRPNSVVQITSVSSNIPRDFRSRSSPAIGRSVSPQCSA